VFRTLILAALSVAAWPCSGRAAPRIVAAERAYADIAAQVAGPDAPVTALLTNPTLDPHEFEPTPSVARKLADATITIANGLGYDSWMDRLQAATPPGSVHLVVGDLLHRQAGENPHLWYDPAAMPALVDALAHALSSADPAHAIGYASRARSVQASLTALCDRVALLRRLTLHLPVGATEPVFGPMEAALGMNDRFGRFELAQMNGTEPRASDVAALQDNLRSRRLRMLFMNAQSTGPGPTQLVAIARSAHVPVVAVAENLPQGQSYQAWIGATLDAVASALDYATEAAK